MGELVLHSPPSGCILQWLHAGALLPAFLGLRELRYPSPFAPLRMGTTEGTTCWTTAIRTTTIRTTTIWTAAAASWWVVL